MQKATAYAWVWGVRPGVWGGRGCPDFSPEEGKVWHLLNRGSNTEPPPPRALQGLPKGMLSECG